MRRYGWIPIALLLTACGGVPPTANIGATATRGAELAQIATLTAPTATAIETPTISATPTSLPPTPSAVPAIPTAPSPSDAPTPTAVSPTATPVPPTATQARDSGSSPGVVTVLSDGTGDLVNIRSAPNMSAQVLTQVPAGTELQLHDSSDTMSGDGWHWVKVEMDHGGIGYIRRDLVSAARTASSVTSTPVIVATHTDLGLTNTPRGYQPDEYAWAVPQSLGGYLATRCDAHYVSESVRYAGAYDCATIWYANMDAVVSSIRESQGRGEHFIYLAVPPNPPRVYLQDVYTAIAYTDGGIYLAQATNDKTAVYRARAVAQAECGLSCNVYVTYFWQR